MNIKHMNHHKSSLLMMAIDNFIGSLILRSFFLLSFLNFCSILFCFVRFLFQHKITTIYKKKKKQIFYFLFLFLSFCLK